MATRLTDVPKNTLIRDVFHTAPRASEMGAAGMRQLETVAEIKAEALALYYRATGVVARDVPDELRSNAYEIQRGRQSPIAGVDRLCEVLRRRIFVRRNLTRAEARTYAAQMLELCRQLIDLKLPVTPDPRPTPADGHTGQPSRLSADRDHCAHRGGVGELLGSEDAPRSAA